MTLLVTISFDDPRCSRDTGVFEVTGIMLYPDIYFNDDFEYAMGIYEHPDSFETFFKLYDSLDLVQLFFHYEDESHDAPENTALDRDDLARMSRLSEPEIGPPEIAMINLYKVWRLNRSGHYFLVKGLHEEYNTIRDDVPELYEEVCNSIKEVLQAVSHTLGNPIEGVELVVLTCEELEELEEFENTQDTEDS